MNRYKTNYRMALALAIISLLAAAPIYASLAAPELSRMLGCPKPGGDTILQCVALGMDWGPALTTMALGGLLMFVTLPIGAVFFVLWLAVWLSKRLTAGQPETETARPSDAARVKLWMVRILAGITSLANLPWYFAIGMPFLLKPAYDPPLGAIQQSMVTIGNFSASIASKALIGWVFLALILWLTYPRNRHSRKAA